MGKFSCRAGRLILSLEIIVQRHSFQTLERLTIKVLVKLKRRLSPRPRFQQETLSSELRPRRLQFMPAQGQHNDENSIRKEKMPPKKSTVFSPSQKTETKTQETQRTHGTDGEIGTPDGTQDGM